MGRLIGSLIGLGVLSYFLYLYIQRGSGVDAGNGAGPASAKQVLDRTRDDVKQINEDAQKRANEMFERTQ